MALVLSLQTTGPMLLRALTSQDMYLAGSLYSATQHAHRHRYADFGHSVGNSGSAHPFGKLVKTLLQKGQNVHGGHGVYGDSQR